MAALSSALLLEYIFVTYLPLCSEVKIHPTIPLLQRLQATNIIKVWADPLSLAATKGISVDVFSSGYLDVSVLQVVFLIL